jgi:hypothetical protein
MMKVKLLRCIDLILVRMGSIDIVFYDFNKSTNSGSRIETFGVATLTLSDDFCEAHFSLLYSKKDPSSQHPEKKVSNSFSMSSCKKKTFLLTRLWSCWENEREREKKLIFMHTQYFPIPRGNLPK